MIYLKTDDGDLRLIILETSNLDRLKEGRAAKTPDKSVWICWTPDPAWLAEQILNAKGDMLKVAELVKESQKRPEQPTRAPFKTEHHVFEFDSRD